MVGALIKLPFRMLTFGVSLILAALNFGVRSCLGVFRFVFGRVFGTLVGAIIGLLLGKKHIGVRIFPGRRKRG
jgi:hypothetical protein